MIIINNIILYFKHITVITPTDDFLLNGCPACYVKINNFNFVLKECNVVFIKGDTRCCIG